MTDYHSPIADMRFVLDAVCDLEGLQRIEAYAEATPDMVDAILEEAARLAEGVIAPTNRTGDQEGSRLKDGSVVTPAGFREAYRQYVDGGWNGLTFEPAHGGQGLPFALGCAVQEMWTAANMAFSLCPMLTLGSVVAISLYGTEEQKAKYLGKLVSGEWTGSMNLTEPQAGSDVGALKTRAEKQLDGSYRIKGTKIFITYGDHDLTDNIIHLVLARTPGAPDGTRGISLFIVPKFLVGDDGAPGERNDVTCVSLEHKLGIHASPTCVLSYGDNDKCVGYLIGEECQGMRAMFAMMNHARINVGLQGVAIAERAYQQALAYAKERIQAGPIIGHADVRRMLMTIRAQTEAARAITYLTAASSDVAHAHPDAEVREKAQGRADLLTPVAKAYATDIGVEAASLGVQIHGGMGYVEETGAAQHLRDARIAPIYEGTNGIQAMDLVGRKLNMDGGAHWKALFAEVRDFTATLPSSGDLGALKPYLEDGLDALQNASVWLMGNDPEQQRNAAAAATPYLRIFGTVIGGYLLAKSAQEADRRLAASEGDAAYLKAKVATARFFAEQLMPPATALLGPITRGADGLYAIPDEIL